RATSDQRHQSGERIRGFGRRSPCVVHARAAECGQSGAVPTGHTVLIIQRMHAIDADQQYPADALGPVEVIRICGRGHKYGKRKTESRYVPFIQHRVLSLGYKLSVRVYANVKEL